MNKIISATIFLFFAFLTGSSFGQMADSTGPGRLYGESQRVQNYVKPTQSQQNIGGWQFKLQAYPGTIVYGYPTCCDSNGDMYTPPNTFDDQWLVGSGTYDSSAGTFSGSVMCDPSIYGGHCGNGGNVWCNSDQVCTHERASMYNYGSSWYNTVTVSAIPVISVTKKW